MVGLTVLGAGDVGQDTEGLGLQVSCATGPVRQLGLLLLILDHGLVDGGRTVYERVFDWERAAITKTVTSS